jgi:tol-pal system beta propeller repeat protein TolB
MRKPAGVLSFACCALVAAVVPSQGRAQKPTPRVAYASNLEGNWEIYLTAQDDRPPIRLTRRKEQDRFPLWSPDGSRIAFGSQVSGDHWELWVMDADGTNQRQLATNIVAKGHRQWSPDGRSIVFAASVNGDREVFTVEVGSGRVTRLTNVSGEDGDPAWSPDGSLIAFSSTRDGNPEIYVMRADGTEPRRITVEAAADGSPDWSPDGSRIAFVSKRGGDGDVWLARIDDGSLERVTTGAHATNDGARWSPDGAWIAVQTSEAVYQIKLIRMSDRQVRTVPGTATYDGQLSWSPTSNQLVFISGRNGVEAVYLTEVGGQPRRVTATPSLNPALSP